MAGNIRYQRFILMHSTGAKGKWKAHPEQAYSEILNSAIRCKALDCVASARTLKRGSEADAIQPLSARFYIIINEYDICFMAGFSAQ